VLAWSLGATLIAALGGALPAVVLLGLSRETRKRVVPWLVAFAAGALLGAAFVDLLPEALAAAPAREVSVAVLLGMLGFLLMDLTLAHQHGHAEAHEHHHGAVAPLVLVGDALHNLVDGVTIAAAFGVSVPVGVGTTLAVLAHEVPQELGNVAVLLDAGYGAKKALAWNVAVNALAVVGALLGTLVLDAMRAFSPYVLAVASANFLYVAAADLIPGLHRAPRRTRLAQGLMLLAGAGIIAWVHRLAG
jgi:zinc and cadmium transporter